MSQPSSEFLFGSVEMRTFDKMCLKEGGGRAGVTAHVWRGKVMEGEDEEKLQHWL